jgi:hypothetical protein
MGLPSGRRAHNLILLFGQEPLACSELGEQALSMF